MYSRCCLLGGGGGDVYVLLIEMCLVFRWDYHFVERMPTAFAVVIICTSRTI